jgi:TRAP-type mannitol/chloroaromatic compound transport system permease small subunit
MATPASDLNAGAPSAFRLLLNVVDSLGRLDLWLGAACLVALALLMLSEIFVRALSNFAGIGPGVVPNAWEYSSYLMAASFTFGAAMTLRAGGHIRVSILLANTGPLARRLIEIVSSLVGALATSFLTYSMVLFTWASYSRGQVSISSGTIVWPPMALVTFGLALLTLQFYARAIRAAWNLPLEDPSLQASNPVE